MCVPSIRDLGVFKIGYVFNHNKGGHKLGYGGGIDLFVGVLLV